ncbi:hypothetical protein GCM10028821_02300 [Hymenobacter jeollabukensis]
MTTPAACALPVYDLATIAKTHKRLSTDDVQQMMRQNPGLPSFFKDYSQYTDLLVLDTLRCQGYTLVPVLWRHEDCCEDLVYLTTSSDGSAVLDSMRVAGRGMDGQWHAEASMRLASHGELLATVLEENASDSESEPNVLDSVVTAYAVSPQGRFTKRQVSSVQRNLRAGEHIPGPKK